MQNPQCGEPRAISFLEKYGTVVQNDNRYVAAPVEAGSQGRSSEAVEID